MGLRAARRALAVRRDPSGGWLPRRRGFPRAGSARLSLARCHHRRRLGLAAHRGNERRDWFLGEPSALPIKPPQGAKSKSQSPSLQTRRHPISWETATPNDKPRIFSLARGGEFSTAVLGGPGTPTTDGPSVQSPGRSNADASPTRKPPTQPLSLEPRALELAAAARRLFFLTWIPRSWKSRSPCSRQELLTGFPLLLRRRHRLQSRH